MDAVSVPSGTGQRATAIFALEKSRIETNDFAIPLSQVRGRRNAYTFKIEPGGVELALHGEVNADQWHFCMDHINTRSLELLSKPDANGVHFSRGKSPRDVCAVEGSTQQPHPKKSNLEITMHSQLVSNDLLGPIISAGDEGLQVLQQCFRRVHQVRGDESHPNQAGSHPRHPALGRIGSSAPWLSDSGPSR